MRSSLIIKEFKDGANWRQIVPSNYLYWLGLDPGFPVKYLVYFLIVVAVGGSGSITGSLVASLVLGVVDVVGKYYVPQVGAFVIYAVMVVMLVLRPQGLFGRRAAH